ncbi:MAG: flagellar hook-basal body complex protein [Oscillospiraceae bacterium]|nr:flagellar hook-basal body complex protein [Oscillospiraceae bacterium]
MNRAMFSGVAGLKTHQTKMDVIGNNIANVNTYGFKSQRAIFSDIFYQTLQGASAGTANRGGTNPSSVGYGSQLAAIQTQMSQSSMQSTGYGMDVAITGEGFFQVMDPDGNIFYTKAGIFDYDSNGYLVDVNGNFVLGTESSDGAPDSKKIKLDNIGSVNPAAAAYATTINGIKYTINATNPTAKGNLSMSLGASSQLPKGQDVQASISSSGTITVLLSNDAKFASLADLNQKINAAITEANGGSPHVAGNFELISLDADAIFTANGSLTGAEICGTDFDYQPGTLTVPDGSGNPTTTVPKLFDGAMTIVNTSSTFSGQGEIANFTATFSEADAVNNEPAKWTITLEDANGTVYTGEVADGESYTQLQLKNTSTPDDDDFITVTYPNYDSLVTKYKLANPGSDPSGSDSMSAFATGVKGTLTPAKPSVNLGLSSGSFTLSGGTEGGPVTLDELTSISIGADGIISVTHPEKGTVAAGRISLANFANPAGLELNGTNYYSASANSGEAQLCDPGSDGTGSLKSNALEMSNVDLSSEFADMITTQRGFQANSRIITVSDTMLEELINLKR